MTSVHAVDVLVGRRVRAQRQLKGLSQTTLASAIGVTFQQLQKYEKATNRISASKLFEIAQVLHVDVGIFFDGPKISGTESADSEAIDLGRLDRIDLKILRKLLAIRGQRIKHSIYLMIAEIADMQSADDERGAAAAFLNEEPAQQRSG